MKRTRLLALLVVSSCALAAPAAAHSGARLDPEPVDQPPLARADTATVVAGAAVRIDVLANDEDQDGLPDDGDPALHVSGVDALDGRVTTDGTAVTLTSRAGDAGASLAFDYEVTDGEAVATGSVEVSVQAPPVAPTVTIGADAVLVALHRNLVRGRASLHGSAPATISLQRRVAGHWSAVGSAKADASGVWSVPFGTNRPGAQVFRARAAWDDGAIDDSPNLSRTVVARADATVSGALTRKNVPYSYRSGCPVGPGSLRRLTIDHLTYQGTVARGSLIVRASAVAPLREVFTNALAAGFRIHLMQPTDAFYSRGRRTPTQSDIAAMNADNTSAFNCRPVTGNPYRVSRHSYGDAIDINTVRNPYVVGSRVYPSFARTYLDRRHVRTGMITSQGVVARTMRGNHWPWGARWSHPDYQHFSATGG